MSQENPDGLMPCPRVDHPNHYAAICFRCALNAIIEDEREASIPENTASLTMSDHPDSLTIPIYEYTDQRRAGVAPCIVVNTPGVHGVFLWDGLRWTSLPESILTSYSSITEEP